MKHYLIYPALALLLCVAVALRLNLPMTRNIPVVGSLGPTGNPNVRGGPIRLTPQRRASFDKAEKLETAARAAKARGDYARAEAYYRAETQVPGYRAPTWVWVNLGLMLDYQGKKGEAFAAYQEGFGPDGHRAGGSNDPERAEAAARLGAMYEARGLHADACECYYASRVIAGPADGTILEYTLEPAKTSSSQVRSLLDIALGNALERDKPQPNAGTLAAFWAAVRLAPGDPRPWYFLAYGLRRAGRFEEAGTALHEVSRLDKGRRLGAAVRESQAEVRGHSREW